MACCCLMVVSRALLRSRSVLPSSAASWRSEIGATLFCSRSKWKITIYGEKAGKLPKLLNRWYLVALTKKRWEFQTSKFVRIFRYNYTVMTSPWWVSKWSSISSMLA
jgi:hypothetical protein